MSRPKLSDYGPPIRKVKRLSDYSPPNPLARLEKDKAARFNITVPADLRAEMEKANGVNWSAVATEAFKSHLLALAAHQEVKTMDDVIARLKAADNEDKSTMVQHGITDGEKWAKQHARPRQLRALMRWREDRNGGLDELFQFAEDSDGIARNLFRVINPLRSSDMSSDGVNAFWDAAIGANGRILIDDREYAAGFINGAMDIWSIVEKEV